MANKTNAKAAGGYEYYRLRVRIGERRNAKGLLTPVYRNFYGKNKKEAERKAQEWLSSNGKKESYFGPTFDSWLQNVFAIEPSIRNSTRRLYLSAYDRTLRKCKELQFTKLEDVTGLQLQEAFNNQTAGASTLKAARNLIVRFFRWAAAEQLCTDVSENIMLPKPKHKKQPGEPIEVWNDDETREILDASRGHRLRFLIVLALNTGARISELLALKYSDIDIDAMTVQISKQVVRGEEGEAYLTTGPLKTDGSFRSVPVNEFVIAEFKKHRTWHLDEMIRTGYRTEFVFTTQSGNLLERHNVNNALKRLYNKCGVSTRPFHTYRHTFASKLAAAGVDLQTVRELLGHSNIETTAEYYISVTEEQKRAAIEKLKVFNALT